jgi:Na+/proline symporter/nitrogen-specific signal transduction histidine kinase
MLATPVIVGISLAYLALLFAVAYYARRRWDAGRSIVAHPSVYALSLGVYATSWTFYGSVGRAASTGVGFLPVYLGPTLMFALGWLVLRKIIRISKENRITSIADFIASRYGKSTLVGGLVTIIAVLGIVPYIALQLKAVSDTVSILTEYPRISSPTDIGAVSILEDKALYVALVLAAFTIVFGTRKLDASERHEGMVAAIAFESVVKLVAFLAVGLYVTFGMFGGFGDIFGQAAKLPEAETLFTLRGTESGYGSFLWLTILSMLAIVLLPRQFHMTVVENVDERHLNRAIWMFPLYLLAINVFVLPIAVGGLVRFDGTNVSPDTFVLALPMADGAQGMALLAYLGGLSAATAMVIVETIALSTMVSNNLVMPALVQRRRISGATGLGGLVLAIRRVTIVLVLLLGFVYFRAAGEATALVSIGLLSFAAVAQFAPALLGGLFWKEGNRYGALTGMLAGFVVWTHTLLLPSLARSGWLSESVLEHGPFGIEALRPEQLFGLTGFDHISHGMFWSMLVNVGLYVGVSLFTHQSRTEQGQAVLFVDAYRGSRVGAQLWRRSASVGQLKALLARFLGAERAAAAIADHARERGLDREPLEHADAGMIYHVETLLAGAIGASSARVMIASVVEEEPLELEEVMHLLGETSQAIAYSHELERKSRELEAATAELRAANRRLQELDRMKDDFVSTVTHELRTPLTSMRAFAEILLDNAELPLAERERFLRIIVEEVERLTRLIDQVLDLSKIESGRAEWRLTEVDLGELIEESATATAQLMAEREIDLELRLPEASPRVTADPDRVKQVVINLLSNAAKYCDASAGRVIVELGVDDGAARADVRDNGPGVRPEERHLIFERFRQGSAPTGRRAGTGLGLAISRDIIRHLVGDVWVEGAAGEGATFSFTLPLAPTRVPEEPAGRPAEEIA